MFRKKIKKIITDSDTITYNVEPNGSDKTYMDKELKIISFMNNRSIQWKKNNNYVLFNIFKQNTFVFYDGSGKTCKILFANDEEIKQVFKWWKFKWKK